MLQQIKVAQLRGNGLSDREIKTWEYFPADIVSTVFETHKNALHFSPVSLPVVKLRASSDTFFTKNFFKYFFGQYQRMFDLESRLAPFDVVHTGELFNYYTYQAVAAKRKHQRGKVVATIWENSFGRFEYNYWPGFKMPPRYWREQLARIIQFNVQGVDMFLPATEDAAGLLRDYGVPAEKIRVTVPGIIPADPGIKTALPRRLAGKEIYLMVNRLVKEKGVYDVLYGWRIYLRQTTGTDKKVLAIIGDGPEHANMVRLVMDWGLDDKIIFIRQMPYTQMMACYSGAHCLILGSIPQSAWQEQFGYVLAEAICADVPIIATYCGAIPEVVGEAGLLVPPAHPLALSKALLAMDDQALYRRLKASCVLAAQKFDVVAYANQVAQVYREVARL